MDAVKFVEERRRMYTLGCIKKGINDYNTKAEAVVAEVEAWAAAHPRKTRQSVFLEQWPDTQLDKEGNVIICPKQLCKGEEFNKLMAACRGTSCCKCRREFYTQEVEQWTTYYKTLLQRFGLR